MNSNKRFLMAVTVMTFLSSCGNIPSEHSTTVVPHTFDHPSGETDNYYAVHCQGRLLNLKDPLSQITSYLESKAIYYNSIPLSDCSGMFHRVLMMLDNQCPGQALPSHKKYRSTRQLAEWYYRKGKLVIIQDALSSSDLIKPGSVMFFGKQGRRYRNFTASQLFLRSRGIEHMGIVVAVQRDRTGRVLSYRMFHGRKSGTIAKTTLHKRIYNKRSYPAYGNGSQQWVAVARIIN